MSWYEPNTMYRIFSANRANILPPPAKPTDKDLNKKSANMYITLAGDVTTPVLTNDTTMQDGMDADLLWVLRAADATNTGNWTIHFYGLGLQYCLERVDTSKGTLKMGNFVKGKPTSAQRWFIKPELLGSVAVCTISEGSTATPPPPSSSLPAKLDIGVGDKIFAKTTSLTPLAPADDKFKLEGARWCIQYARPVPDGFAS